MIPLISVTDSVLEFQGGFMVGLNVDNELTKTGGGVKVRITKMVGANRSQGTVVSGKISDVHPGELFEVSNWVSSSAPFLKLYTPDNTLSYEQVDRISAVCRQVKLLSGIKWMNDLEKQDPDVSIYYTDNQWMANDSDNNRLRIDPLSAKAIADVVKTRSVYVSIPPPLSLINALQQALAPVKSIQLTTNPNPNDAQYFLAGTVDDNNQLCYGWVKSQTLAEDSLEAMPLQTRTVTLMADTKEELEIIKSRLYESCLKLSKIRAWLNLQVPAATSQFPFHLEIRNDATNQAPGGQGIAVGNTLSFYLTAGENYLAKWDRKKKFVYVFLIDRNGTMTLMYPSENSGNVNNRYPLLDDKEQPLPEIKLLEGDVTEPVGTDTYFLLQPKNRFPIIHMRLTRRACGAFHWMTIRIIH